MSFQNSGDWQYAGCESEKGRAGHLMGPDEVTVRCYSGYTYAERPQSFMWRGTEYEVTQVVREWLEPGVKCFLVATGGNKLFQLCYNVAIQRWSLTELAGE